MTTTGPRCAVLTANDRFKLRYPRTLKGATLAAIALTALMVWLSPRYEPQPYVLRNTEIILEDIEVLAPLEDLPRPAPPPRMRGPVEPVSDPALEDPVGIPNLGDIWNPAPPAPPAVADDGFVASSAKPVLKFFVKADYPEIARHAGLEGTVVVHVLVRPDGRVSDAVVVRGVHPLLDRAAVAAARRCVFTPAMQREFPVKAWLAVPYRFSLR